MSDIKKALLTTIFRVPNFGSVLQAYATQFVISSFGWQCNILNYNHNESKWAKVHSIKGTNWKRKVALKIGLRPHHRKVQKLNAFIQQNFHLTRSYKDHCSIEHEQGRQYDVYITGSDQVWKPQYTNCDPVFLQQFAQPGKKRISYASSFASHQLDAKHTEIFQRELSKFSAISVREKQGIEIVRNLGIDEVQQVLDPTLLLSAKEWDHLRTGKQHHEPYILLYMLTYAFEPRPYIYKVLKHFQEKLQYKIIALEGYDAHDREQQELDIIDATDSSIGDFLQYFANASLVITTSFHGTAFALIYGIPLVSIIPGNEDDRQNSLLNQLHLEQCKLTIGEDINNIQAFYNREIQQEKLASLRKESLSWFKKNINF